MDKVNKIVGFVLLGAVAFLGIFDLFMMLKYGPTNTISWWVYTMSKDWPILVFLAGIVAGHFWFPMKGIDDELIAQLRAEIQKLKADSIK